MSGGFKDIKIKNWRRLLVLAVLATAFFSGAFWLTRDRANDSDNEAEAEPQISLEQASDRPAPLPNTARGDQVRALFADGDYQNILPEAKKPVQRKSVPMPQWVGKLILYALTAAGIFTIAAFIWILITGNSGTRPASSVARNSAKKKKERAAAPDHMLARNATFEEAEAMARSGNYGEAVRMLLAVSLISLSRRELVRLRPWMTGREIVRDAALVEDAARALEQMVHTVEAYAFAGHEISRALYQSCMEHYRMLASDIARVAK